MILFYFHFYFDYYYHNITTNYQSRRSIRTMCLFINFNVTSNLGCSSDKIRSVENLYLRKIADNITFIVNNPYRKPEMSDLYRQMPFEMFYRHIFDELYSPIQLRGPLENGKYAYGCRFCIFSGKK